MGKKKKIIKIIVILFAVLIAVNAQSYFLFNKYSAQEDIRETVIWMSHLRDNGLFKDNLYLPFLMWKNPIGIKAFYYITGQFFDPLTVVKFLPLVLSAILALYGFKLGCLLRNYKAGIIMACLLIFTAWWHKAHTFFDAGPWFCDGGAGDFYPVILIIFLFYFLKDDFSKSFLVMIAAVLFYPPGYLILCLMYMFSLIKFTDCRLVLEKHKWKWGYFLGSFLVAVCFIIPKYVYPAIGLGSLVKRQQMIQMREFLPGGRTPFFYESIYEQIANFKSGLGLNSPVIILIFISLVILIILRKKAFNLPRQIWEFLGSSLFLFVLANILILKLYEPSRYMRYSLPIFLIIFVSVNLDRIIEYAFKKRSLRLTVYFLVFLVMLFVYCPNLQSYHRFKPDETVDGQLYEFLLSKDKDSLVAAHPDIMDNIVVFSRRKGLIMQELAYPYHRDYYEQVKVRTYDFFKAYYSASGNEIINLCDKYKIDYVVFYKKHFSKQYLTKGDYYLAPFNGYIKNLINENCSGDYAFLKLPRGKIVFADEKYMVFGR
ncbi:MAG: hypothetical protein GY853_03915 [PVC group bacterium]|nr:hypothetical protein [PVC group bacterium]